MILRYACFIAVFVLCNSAALNVTIEGTNRVEACIGENITFTCDVSSGNHVWRVPGLMPPTSVVISGSADVAMYPYTLSFISTSVDNTNNIISSLTVVSNYTFNNVNVTCASSLGDDAEVQHIVAIVLAPPSAPNITAVASSTDSFDITISPPSTSKVCVAVYKVTTNSSVNPILFAEPGSLQFIKSGFNSCSDTYNFTVVPLTLADMNGESSEAFITTSPGRVSDVITTLGSLTWSPPANVPSDCHVQYSITGNVGATLVVDTNIVDATTLNDTGFPYCMRLTVTITPLDVNNTAIDISSSTADVVIDDPEIVAPKLNVILGAMDNNNVFPVSIISMPPTDEKVSITYSEFDSLDCTKDLDETVISFDCSSGGGNVLFCGQFTSEACTSNKTMMSVFIPSCAPAVPLTAIVAGVVVSVIIILVVVIVFVFVILCYCKVKGGKTQEDEHELKGGPSYTATPSVAPVYNDGGGAGDLYDEVTTIKTRSSDNPGDNLPTYQAPDTIRREAVGGGDMYTVPEKKKKKGAAPAADVADMYSVPDKTKKKQNEGLMYADIDMSRPSKKRSRPPPNQGFVVQEDPGSVTYSTVNH